MDTVTQFALGACVGAGVLGRAMGPRRAALTGGLLGVAPDLDVFFVFENALESFVEHRGATHSLVIHAAITPILGEILTRNLGSLRNQRLIAYLAVFLCLGTHSLLDVMTIYGTRLFWPLWDTPAGLGSVFIIDPLYSLPLLAVTVWALFLRGWTARFRNGLALALTVSTLYLGWAAVAQQITHGRGLASLARADISPSQSLAIPTPFNAFFWRMIAVDGSRYFNVYVPIFGDDNTITTYAHPRQPFAASCLSKLANYRRLAAFTKGYVRADLKNDELVVSDLRMGLTPDYYFRFVVGETAEGSLQSVEPRQLPSAPVGKGNWEWIWNGIVGNGMGRPQEQAFVLDVSQAFSPADRLGTAAACEGG